MATASGSSTDTVRRERPSTVAMLLLALILVVRLAAVLMYTPPVTDDQAGYEASAYRLATVGSFAYPTAWSEAWSASSNGLVVDYAGRQALAAEPRNAQYMPGYPAFRAAILKLVGDGEPWRIWTRIAQSILSVLGALLIYLLARRYSERAGVLTLVISLLYQPLITANSHLLTEVLFTYLLVACVYCIVLWSEHRVIGRAAAIGLFLGLAFWVRPTVLPWGAMVAIIALVHYRSERRHVALHVTIAGLVAIAVMCPWWIRNYDVYHRFVPLSTIGSTAAIVGIQIDATHQWPYPWQSSGPKPTSEQLAIQELTTRAMDLPQETKERGDLAVSDALGLQFKRLRSEMAHGYVVPALRLRLRSILVALAQPYAYVKWTLWYSAMTGILHYLLLGAYIPAVFVFRRRIDALMVASVPLYLIAIHAIVLPFNRYVFPAMPFVVILAAALIDHVARRRAASLDVAPTSKGDAASLATLDVQR